ncbi:LysM peptidoglycan-binding domain-containing protein [Negadavirga shengliensis]|uniref:LysM peptidoglycan-binding domain-containing protein n=1 Tax=Negadavirga shengliensis TaxID=1389218 RepID=A0ABV9SYV7_9BACT
MQRKIFVVFLFFTLTNIQVMGQVPQVPQVIYFADMSLRLNEQARREIQADVNALYRNATYFQTKLDRVNLYMPIVERVLREQGVPEDFKYLVIQESSLIPDAVSTSNAVGFWQFKKGTAEEVFMRVDNQVDERKNIVSSTRGAAAYLKKHQNHLDNWACALVSYQMGLGGARGYFKDQFKGKRTMDIDRNSHWYLKKFLAHKIAFDGQTGRLVSNGNFLHEYPVKGPTTLSAVAKTLGVSESHLKEYNKWTNGQIPGDRTYVVTYILKDIAPVRPAIASSQSPTPDARVQPARRNAQGFPRVTGNQNKAVQPNEIRVNNIKGILALKDGSQTYLANQARVSERRIRKANDLKKSDPIQAGQYYYTKKKKAKAEVEEHIVQPGETLWQISQLYGIRLHSLKAKNRIYKDKDLQPGMVLKLRGYLKRNEEIPMARQLPMAQNPAPPQNREVAENKTPTVTTSTNSGSQSSGPAASPPPRQNSEEYLVQPGDTLYAISRKHGITIDQLKTWNNLGDDHIIKVGQKLIIHK